MALFKHKKTIQLNKGQRVDTDKINAAVPDQFLLACPGCGRQVAKLQVTPEATCPRCHYHFQMPAKDRISWLVDPNSFEPIQGQDRPLDPLAFPDYPEKLKQLKDKTGLDEAVMVGFAKIGGYPVGLGVMDSRFMMASMGTKVGESLTSLFEEAYQKRLPVVLYIASGGARMQEGILSLMQMAKVSQAVAQHSQAGLFYLAILTHPTTGGVTASFAMQADIVLAEPGATVGFAGQRVIEQTIKAQLPSDFQAAEKVLSYGFIDNIVARDKQKDVLKVLLTIHGSKEA